VTVTSDFDPSFAIGARRDFLPSVDTQNRPMIDS